MIWIKTSGNHREDSFSVCVCVCLVRVTFITGCEFSQDRKGGGGVKEEKRGGNRMKTGSQEPDRTGWD